MTNFKLAMLAAAAMGAATIGGASAMPLDKAPALGQSLVHDARVVCNQWGQCYDTRKRSRTWYSSRHNRNYAQPHYGYDRRYQRAPRAAITVGPFGIFAR